MKELPRAILSKAPWNYKQDDAERKAKLIESIKRDGSYGIVAVRRLATGNYEVIDGNHRYDALCVMDVNPVRCEDFGDITLAEAISICRRRNATWFEDDLLALSKLYSSEVLPTVSAAELAKFMPESEEQIKNLADLSSLDWDAMRTTSQVKATGKRGVNFSLDVMQEKEWLAFTAMCGQKFALTDKLAIFMLMLRSATEHLAKIDGAQKEAAPVEAKDAAIQA